MDISLVIAALKERCTSFGGRVAGAAEYKRIAESAQLTVPAAYVIPMDDEAGENQTLNGYRQDITDVIAVIVVLSNTVDELGNVSINTVRLMRAELCRALAGWPPDAEHERLIYEGGHLLELNRVLLSYQFEFSAITQISEADTWQGISNAALPAFTSIKIDVDAIDPRDPNKPGTGPDGTIEATATISIPQV